MGSHFASARIANLRAQGLFQSGAEAERETREAIVRGGDVRGADAARQKRSETFYFGDDELTREVRVKLVQRHVSERRAQNPNGASNRSVEVDRVHRNSIRENSSKRTPADRP